MSLFWLFLLAEVEGVPRGEEVLQRPKGKVEDLTALFEARDELMAGVGWVGKGRGDIPKEHPVIGRNEEEHLLWVQPLMDQALGPQKESKQTNIQRGPIPA